MAHFSRQPSSSLPSSATPTTPVVGQASGPGAPPAPQKPRGHPGWLVAASLAIGLVAVALLVAAPFVPVTEPAMTGAVLCGFALGWAALFWLSRRFTNRPQRWAALPALFMGGGGLLLLAFGSPLLTVLSWVWPPVLLVLVVWMARRVRRDLRSRAGRIQLYAVFTILALCAVAAPGRR